MKNILLLLFLGFIALKAQDKEPDAWHFVWGNKTYSRPFDPNEFPQTSVLTGFQWSGSVNMNNALLNNCSAGGGYPQLLSGESRTYPLQHVQ